MAPEAAMNGFERKQYNVNCVQEAVSGKLLLRDQIIHTEEHSFVYCNLLVCKRAVQKNCREL